MSHDGEEHPVALVDDRELEEEAALVRDHFYKLTQGLRIAAEDEIEELSALGRPRQVVQLLDERHHRSDEREQLGPGRWPPLPPTHLDEEGEPLRCRERCAEGDDPLHPFIQTVEVEAVLASEAQLHQHPLEGVWGHDLDMSRTNLNLA